MGNVINITVPTWNIEAFNGYKTITSFWSDFSIADHFGEKGIKDTFQKVFEEWKGNYKYLTELVLVLNHKIWVIQRYNRYIREHMAKVAKLLDMEQTPSPTWARHSFATNLSNSGVVPYKYISDSMGHSGGGDITSNYIGAYPLVKMLEYNHYLLNEKPKEAAPIVDKKALLEMLKGLSEEERMELMANLSD